MNRTNILKTALLVGGCQIVLPALATTTYVYTDAANSKYSGSFSVASALSDGSYNFLSPASQPAGFAENFFSASFVDGSGATRTPSISAFNVTIHSGQVSAWNIQASTPFTLITWSGGKKYVKVTHAAHLTFTASTLADAETYYLDYASYQVYPTGINSVGLWSGGGLPPAPAVPEPETWGLMLAGLGFVGLMKRRRKSGTD